MYIQKISIKIALSSNDNKRIILIRQNTSYPYGYKGKQALT